MNLVQISIYYLIDLSCNIFVLALYIDEFIIVGNLEQFMMWREKTLTNEDGMKDKEGR
jgi:hypothetical protein